MAIAVTVLVLGNLAVSPALTVQQMRAAAKQRDGRALAGYAAFPALRQNLKELLNRYIGHEVLGEIREEPLAVLGAALAGVMVDSIAEVFVTPSALSES